MVVKIDIPTLFSYGLEGNAITLLYNKIIAFIVYSKENFGIFFATMSNIHKTISRNAIAQNSVNIVGVFYNCKGTINSNIVGEIITLSFVFMKKFVFLIPSLKRNME